MMHGRKNIKIILYVYIGLKDIQCDKSVKISQFVQLSLIPLSITEMSSLIKHAVRNV